MDGTRRLLDLQALDLTRDRLEVRRRSLEAGEELAAARAEADEAERAVGELRLEAGAMDRDASKLEHEIDSLQQKASAEERRMFDGSVANPKELDAMRHEVENLKRRIGDREEELLALMEARESLEARLREEEGRFELLRAAAEQVAATSEASLVEVTAELADRAAEREAILPDLDAELLEEYEDLRLHKRGVGAATLVDGVCQGCHETLSAVELDRVKRADGIKRCEHCRRILVL